MATGKGKSDTFERQTFSVSRDAEFASVEELQKQTGHPVEDWLLVVVKEFIDNALDDSEQAGLAPLIDVHIDVEGAVITVADHGSGIAPAVVKKLVDYRVKTSSNVAYVSPTRGQQGNALHSIIPMGCALAREHGWNASDAVVIIESQGVAHTIGFAVDPVRQTASVSHAKKRSAVKIGTRVTVRWPHEARFLIAKAEPRFLSLLATYQWVNPHLTLDATWGDYYPIEASDPGWSKWTPNLATSPHWYDEARLKFLIAALIANAEDRKQASLSVRDFIGQFRGLTGTAKQNAICAEIGVAEREKLADFLKRPADAGWLLAAMQAASRPVKAKDLGVIGEAHLTERLVEYGCLDDTVEYRKAEMIDDGLPYVIEAAFGWRGDEPDQPGRHIVEGFNFSAAIGDSPFRLDEFLAHARIERHDAVDVFAHVTAPRFNFLDKGKAQVDLPPVVKTRLRDMVVAVTAKWTRQKRAEIRNEYAALRRRDALVKRDRPMKVIEAAYEVMRDAYMLASDDGEGGRLPVKPRQIMYRARPHILAMTGRQTFSDGYFTQKLLVWYMRDNPDETKDWDIIWDDRGHFAEPHTGREIGLGTLAVREYLANLHEPEIAPARIADAYVSTLGPAGRYHGVLFVEKEGFEPIFEAVRLYERYDLAPMSTKGMSTTAGRALVEELCGRRGLPLFTLHDFDKTGFSIHETLTSDTERYAFTHALDNIVEIGLRLDDIRQFERDGAALLWEPVPIKRKKRRKQDEGEDEDFDEDENVIDENLETQRANLRKNDATEDEIEELLTPMEGQTTGGKRVELNAMTSRQLIDFVEGKLKAYGLTKVVPDREMLAETYAAFKRGDMAREALNAELARLNAMPVDVPDDLDAQVRAHLGRHPETTWDDAVRAIFDGDRER